MNRGGARILVRVGEYFTKFHTWIQLKPCIAMTSPKFRFERGDIKQNCITFDKFWKIYKKFAQKLKNYPKFFKNKYE